MVEERQPGAKQGGHAIPYRPEVDGLRAVAVVAVILFHAKVAGFAGGFVGVDVFFVISGYLITSIIVREVAARKFSIVRFYERRARRILPALSVVLLVSSIFAFVLMPPVLLTQYSQAVVATMGFAANVFSFLTTDYFSTAADEKPLLHMWSLGVEEQFYFVFPLLLLVLYPRGKRVLGICLATLGLGSFLVAEWLLSQKAYTAAFFLIFSRGWELMVGAGLALLPRSWFSKSVRWTQVASLVGLLMIVCATVFYTEQTPFPGVYALLPVVGAALVIAYAGPANWVGRLLSHPIFVWVGLISYSLYLWHQPVFAFTRIAWTGEPAPWVFAVGTALSFGLAYLSWRYVEQPFRNKQRIGRNPVFAFSAVSMAFFFCLGALGHFKKGFAERFDADVYYAEPKGSPKKPECYTMGADYLRPSQACRYFGNDVTWAVMGDSHSQEPAYALAEKLENKNEGVLQLSFMACPPILSYEVNEAGCSEWLKESMQVIEDDQGIEHVLLAYRHTLYLHGEHKDAYPEVEKKNALRGKLLLSKTLTLEQTEQLYRSEFRKMVERFKAAGKQVHVLYPIPELPMDIRKGTWPVSIFHDSPRMNLKQSTSVEYYLQRHEFPLQMLKELGGVGVIRPFDVFCDDRACFAEKDRQLLYRDDDHLSLAGARLLFQSVKL